MHRVSFHGQSIIQIVTLKPIRRRSCRPHLREYHFTERSYGPHDGKHILYCIIYDYVVRCGFNSWGDWWGENGTFRVLRGVNECDIESSVVGVWALQHVSMTISRCRRNTQFAIGTHDNEHKITRNGSIHVCEQ